MLPLDDRFYTRALGREGLYAERELMTLYEGAVRILPFSAPETLKLHEHEGHDEAKFAHAMMRQ